MNISDTPISRMMTASKVPSGSQAGGNRTPVAASTPLPGVDSTAAKEMNESRPDNPVAKAAIETKKAEEQQESIDTVRQLKSEQQEQKQQTARRVEKAIKDVREFVQKNQRTLDFQMAEESNRVIITVIDRATNEVIRQIPPEDLVKLADRINAPMDDSANGLLFKGTA
jgi:flagellar protein FlaG